VGFITFYCLRFDTPNLEGQVPCIYILQEQGGIVIPPRIGFPFRRLQILAQLWWRYWNPPPHGGFLQYALIFCLLLSPNGSWISLCSFSTEHTDYTAPTAIPLLRGCLLHLLPSNSRCLQSRYLATTVVYLLISRSLHGNGPTSHSIIIVFISFFLQFLLF
jgi:hypothetical protein